MNTQSKGLYIFSILVILSMVLAACAQPTPERIVETVVVTEIVEGEVQEVIKTVEVAVVETVEVPAEEEGPIVVGQGNLVPCQPLPEVALSSVAQVSHRAAPGPEIVSDVPASAVEPSVAPQQGGKIYSVGVFSDITTLNFWGANGPDNTVYNAYMLPKRLSLYNQTAKYFTLVPQVAMDMSEPLIEEGDFWVVEIPIRDDIKWSDGTAFTAEDVAWTANAVLKLGLISGNWSSWYDPKYLEKMEAVDDATVKIYYHTKPGLARHEFGTLGAPILSKAFWEGIVEDATAPIDALGDGPGEEELLAAQAEAHDVLFAASPDGEPTAGAYSLNKWEPGAFLQHDAYADFLDKGLVVEQWSDASYRDSAGFETGDMEGEPETTYEVGPFADSVIYTIYGSQDAAVLALRDGEVDFLLNSLGLQRGLADQVRNDPDLTVIENAPNSFRYLSFNTRRRPMNDCAFRQAVAVLIDKEFVTSTILQGVAMPVYAFVAPSNAFWYNPDVAWLGQGMSRQERLVLAMAILEQAGYSWEGDQAPGWNDTGSAVIPAGRLIMPDGTPVPQLHLPAPGPGYDPMRSTFAIWIETWLNEFGIPVQAELAGFNTLIPIIFTEQEFDMYILGWSLNIFPTSLFDFFAEEQAVEDGNNAGGYVNPEYEELAQQLIVCDNLEACKEIAFQLQAILSEELPYVVLFNSPIIEAYRSATLEYPWTEQLSGLQYDHSNDDLEAFVKIK